MELKSATQPKNTIFATLYLDKKHSDKLISISMCRSHSVEWWGRALVARHLLLATSKNFRFLWLVSIQQVWTEHILFMSNLPSRFYCMCVDAEDKSQLHSYHTFWAMMKLKSEIEKCAWRNYNNANWIESGFETTKIIMGTDRRTRDVRNEWKIEKKRREKILSDGGWSERTLMPFPNQFSTSIASKLEWKGNEPNFRRHILLPSTITFGRKCLHRYCCYQFIVASCVILFTSTFPRVENLFNIIFFIYFYHSHQIVFKFHFTFSECMEWRWKKMEKTHTQFIIRIIFLWPSYVEMNWHCVMTFAMCECVKQAQRQSQKGDTGNECKRSLPHR